MFCRIRKQVGGWAMVSGQAPSAMKARESLKEVLRKAGCEGKGVTDKKI